jgi:hypothetical protein
VSSLEGDKRQLEDTAQQLQAQVATNNAFGDAVAPILVKGRLSGRSVLLVRADDTVSSDVVDGLTTLVGDAGGRVAGQVTLLPAYTDPATAPSLQSYVTGPGKPPGVLLPETDDTGQLVAALMGQVLMVAPGGPTSAETDTAPVSSVLAGLSALDVVAQDSATVSPADYAVVLAGTPATDTDAATRAATLVDLATALDAAGSGAVVAGDADSDVGNGLVAAVRADPVTSAAVSTVDNVDTSTGRITTVMALGQEAQGTSGKYGTGRGTQPVPPVTTP